MDFDQSQTSRNHLKPKADLLGKLQEQAEKEKESKEKARRVGGTRQRKKKETEGTSHRPGKSMAGNGTRWEILKTVKTLRQKVGLFIIPAKRTFIVYSHLFGVEHINSLYL